jgi:hypothetical protein
MRGHQRDRGGELDAQAPPHRGIEHVPIPVEEDEIRRAPETSLRDGVEHGRGEGAEQGGPAERDGECRPFERGSRAAARIRQGSARNEWGAQADAHEANGEDE